MSNDEENKLLLVAIKNICINVVVFFRLSTQKPRKNLKNLQIVRKPFRVVFKIFIYEMLKIYFICILGVASFA